MTQQAEGFLMPVGDGDIDRTCPGCGQRDDDDPRHAIAGVRRERQTAILGNGARVPVEVPVDVAWHMDCHAAIGCDHCAEQLAAHGGSVKGKVKDPQGDKGLTKTPRELADLEPWEFAHPDENGVMVRVRTKAEAREHRLDEHGDRTLEVAEG